MASTIKVKRSAVQGKAPTTGNLDAGELALNTRDGRLYSKGTQVFEVGANNHSLYVGTGGATFANGAFSLPTSDGTADQVIKTNGSGVLSWTNQSGGDLTGSIPFYAYDNTLDTINLTSQISSTALANTNAYIASVSATERSALANTNAYIASVASSVGKNLIINGNMRIDQRNGGSAVTGITTAGSTFITDRFKVVNETDGQVTAQQSTTAPAGFTNSLYTTVTTVDSSLGSTQYAEISQRIEGNNMSHLEWGTSDAKTVTISFWVRSSLTGDYGVGVYNYNGSYCYFSDVTINTADTWEKKTITITGPTSGTWYTDNLLGLQFHISLGTGSSYQGTADAWTTSSFIVASSNQANWIGTSGATFYLTGVQLEVGGTATDFENRPYATELHLCQRYYFSSLNTASKQNYIGQAISTARIGAGVQFPVQMRNDPTSTIYSPSETAGSVAAYNNVGADTGSGFTAAAPNVGGIYYVTNGTGLTAGNWYAFKVTADAEL